MRHCTSCGQVDDHPRHVIGTIDGTDGGCFHMDCHALLGCQLCLHQLRDADGAQGDQLRAHLTALGPLTPEQITALYAKDTDHG